MSSANSSPRPSRLNESDSPSDGAQESSMSRLPALSVERSSADRTTVSIAGQTARIRAAPGERLTSHAASSATANGERMKNAINSSIIPE